MSLTFILVALSSATLEPAWESGASLADTRSMVHLYGACVLKKQHKRASAAIRANVENGELMKKYPQLIDGKCMPRHPNETVQVKFHGDHFRYALADALVAKEFAAGPALDLEPVPLLDHQVPTPPSRTDARGRPLRARDLQEALEAYERWQAFSYLSRYGECVVRAHPEAARKLLLTVPESAAEQAQFAAMSSALGTCVAEGRTVALNKMSLRGTVAVNYYRLASAAQQLARVQQ